MPLDFCAPWARTHRSAARRKGFCAQLHLLGKVLEPGAACFRFCLGDRLSQALRVIVFSALPEHFAPGIFEHKIDQSIIRPEKLVVVFSLCQPARRINGTHGAILVVIDVTGQEVLSRVCLEGECKHAIFASFEIIP